MTKVEATVTGFKTLPSAEQLADPMAQLSKEFIGLLRDAHKDEGIVAPLTGEQAQKIDFIVEQIVAIVPEIKESTLRKMVLDNPINHGYGVGIAPHDFGEFHRLALNWNNDTYKKLREIAERDYGVTQPIVDFLLVGARILPTPPHINSWRLRHYNRI